MKLHVHPSPKLPCSGFCLYLVVSVTSSLLVVTMEKPRIYIHGNKFSLSEVIGLAILGVLDILMMYGAYSTTRHLAVSRIFIRFIWFTVASVVITFLYVYVSFTLLDTVL